MSKFPAEVIGRFLAHDSCNMGTISAGMDRLPSTLLKKLILLKIKLQLQL